MNGDIPNGGTNGTAPKRTSRVRLAREPSSNGSTVRGLARYMELDVSDASTFVVGAGQDGPRHHNPQVEGAPETLKASAETLARLKRMAGFESQDFDPVENDVQRDFDVHRDHADYSRAEFWKWFIAALIGITMGIIAFLVDWGIEVLNDWKYGAVQRTIRGGGGFLGPFAVYFVYTAAYAAVAGALVSYVEPLAAGSGIPELKTYLNGIHIRGMLAMKTLVAKLVGVMFSISAGLVAGKEGPFVHGGGIVGGGLGGMGSRTLTKLTGGRFVWKAPRAWGGYFRNSADHRDFTAIGTAAGVATAFAAPIGGLLFAIEEGASFYSTSIFWRGFLATCMGVMTLHFFVELKDTEKSVFAERFGVHRDFGLYNDIQAFYGANFYYYVWELPIFILLGCMGGLMGGLFVAVNVEVTKLRHRFIPVRAPTKRLLEVVAMALLTATIFFASTYASPCVLTPGETQLKLINLEEGPAHGNISEILPAGEELAVEDFYQGGGSTQHFPQLWCEDGHYNLYGQLFFVPIAQALRLIIHIGEPLENSGESSFEFDLRNVALFFFVLYCLMVWTYGVGAATGLFVPSLAVGAAGGRIVGRLVEAAARSVDFDGSISLGSYAVVGAAASLGGATRMTLSISVLVMETTGALQLIVPIMLTVFFAKVVGDRFGLGIYDTHIKIRGAPVLEEPNLSYHEKMMRDKLQVKELMTSSVTALPPCLRLRDLIETLRSCAHQAFPITQDVDAAESQQGTFQLQGVILRTQLLKMLRHRIGVFTPEEAGQLPDMKVHQPSTQAERLDVLGKCEQIPVKIREKEEQHEILAALSEDELATKWIDLRPFMQRHPYIISEDASLSRAYRLFRTMGLRHLFVAPSRPHVVGILTRKDVTEENCSLALGDKANDVPFNTLTRPSFGRASLMPHLPFIPYTPYDASAQPLTPTRAALGSGESDEPGASSWDDVGGIPLGTGDRRDRISPRQRGHRTAPFGGEWAHDAEERPLIGSIELSDQ